MHRSQTRWAESLELYRNMFASGARMKDIQMRLGHSRISTTMDIYTHVIEKTDEQLSERLSNYLNDDETDDSQKE